MILRPPAALIADSQTSDGRRLSTLLVCMTDADMDAVVRDPNLACVLDSDDQISSHIHDRAPSRCALITAGCFDSLHAGTPGRLSDGIAQALEASTPRTVLSGALHAPFIHHLEATRLDPSAQMTVSVARCAHLGSRGNLADDLQFYTRLIAARPPRLGPLEHVAIPRPAGMTAGPFDGWTQIRELMQHRKGAEPPWSELQLR